MIQRFSEWVECVNKTPMSEINPIDEILAVILEFSVLGFILFIGRIVYQLEIWYERNRKNK